ncbi:AMP-binding protein [Arthrobacter sp. R1-13]
MVDTNSGWAQPEQVRLWVYQNLRPEDQSYVIRSGRRFGGLVDRSRLALSVSALARRHPVLRWAFSDDAAGLRWHEVELEPGELCVFHSLESGSRDDVLFEEGSRLLDLAGGGLFRVVTLEVMGGTTDIYLMVHQIISDARSTELLWSELARLYNGGSGTDGIDRAYSSRERPSVASELLTRVPEIDVVRTELSPEGDARAPSRVDFAVSLQQQNQVAMAASRYAVTPFTVLLTAFARAISRYDPASEHFAVCTQIDSRVVPEELDSVGFYIRTLPVYFSSSRADPGRQLQATLEQLIDGFSSGTPNLEAVVAASGMSGTDRRHNAFGLLCFQQLANSEAVVVLGDLRGAPIPGAGASTSFGLSFTVEPFSPDGECSAWAHFESSYFSEDLVRALWGMTLDEVRKLGLEVANEPAPPHIGNGGSLISPSPSGLLVSCRSSSEGVIALLSAQPQDNVALVSETIEITYGELFDAVAGRSDLLRNRIPKNSIVGVRTDSVADQISWTLASWVSDCSVLFLESDQVYSPSSAAPIAVVVGAAEPHWCRQSEHAEPDSEIGHSPNRGSDFSGVGYILSTSGTTGSPRRVARQFSPFWDFAIDFARQVERTWRIPLVSELSTDPGMRVMLATLAAGATLVIRNDVRNDDQVSFLSRALTNERVDAILAVTPSLAHAVFAPMASLGMYRHLQMVRCVGEGLHRSTARLVQQVSGPIAHVDYGTSEGGMVSLTHRQTISEETEFLPLGISTGFGTVSIQEIDGEECPPYVVGELVLGGPLVSHGYVDDELEDDLFVDSLGRWFHKTGDLAYRDIQGVVHWVGRKGNTAKVRGLFVDPTKLAASVKSLPGVFAAHAWIDRTVPSDPFLSLAVQLMAGTDLDRTAVRQHVAKNLGRSYIPSSIIQVEQIQFGRSGKAISGPLPAGLPHSELGSERFQISNELMSLFGDSLGGDYSGTDIGFFDAGGSSLSAIRLISDINSRFETDLDFQDLLLHSSPRELHVVIEARRSKLDGDQPGLTVPFGDG